MYIIIVKSLINSKTNIFFKLYIC